MLHLSGLLSSLVRWGKVLTPGHPPGAVFRALHLLWTHMLLALPTHPG